MFSKNLCPADLEDRHVEKDDSDAPDTFEKSTKKNHARCLNARDPFSPMQVVMPTRLQPLDQPVVEIDLPSSDVDMACDGLPTDAGASIEDGPLPSADSLKAARSLLLAEYGPCVACHTQTLVATARRLENSSNTA